MKRIIDANKTFLKFGLLRLLSTPAATPRSPKIAPDAPREITSNPISGPDKKFASNPVIM